MIIGEFTITKILNLKIFLIPKSTRWNLGRSKKIKNNLPKGLVNNFRGNKVFNHNQNINFCQLKYNHWVCSGNKRVYPDGKGKQTFGLQTELSQIIPKLHEKNINT